MSAKTLFLAWQAQQNRQWFPVGQLDADVDGSLYRFCYIGGAKRAEKDAGFEPLLDFPSLSEAYQSSELFPLFRNRVIALGRSDRTDYLNNLDLLETADPVEILSVNGGSRVTDAYEVFPKLVKGKDGSFTCRFFLHGWRYVNESALKRIDSLTKNEELYVTLELTNPATRVAVQIQTTDYHMIGWAPRYLVADLVKAMAESPQYSARVVRVNPQPAPSKQRVLIELSGCWAEHVPMSNEDFQPLVP